MVTVEIATALFEVGCGRLRADGSRCDRRFPWWHVDDIGQVTILGTVTIVGRHVEGGGPQPSSLSTPPEDDRTPGYALDCHPSCGAHYILTEHAMQVAVREATQREEDMIWLAGR